MTALTEQEWLESLNPERMLLGLIELCTFNTDMPYGVNPQVLSDRKMLLFACAVWRKYCDHWGGRTQNEDRLAVILRLVDEAERLADGGVPGEAYLIPEDMPVLVQGGMAAARDVLYRFRDNTAAKTYMADLLRMMLGNPWRPAKIIKVCTSCGGKGGRYVSGWAPSISSTATSSLWLPCVRCNGKKNVAPDWLTLTVTSLAKTAYEDRKQDGTLDQLTLNAIADALEESGCRETCPSCAGSGKVNTSPWIIRRTDHCVQCDGCGFITHPIMTHLRSRTPHYRGDWAIDLLRGVE